MIGDEEVGEPADDEAAEGEAPTVRAVDQADALSAENKDASIKAMERALAESGAAAAQPKNKSLGVPTIPESQDDYSTVEPDNYALEP